MPHGGLGFHFQSEKVGEDFTVPCLKIRIGLSCLAGARCPILFQCLGVDANLYNIVPMPRRCRQSV